MTTLPQVGKYETLEQIGTGGFGVVYKARDPHIQRLVAIKLCTSRSEDVRQRFLREAKIAGNLHHASIVTLFDLGFSDHGPYLVQEYLSGEDLEAKIARREPLPQAQRLEILAHIAAGLQHAHEQGVLHRDVKPANVRILDDGRVKILDFGIAKLFGAETQLTKKGTILGTAGYLAPEQISGRPVDARTDVFAFGVLAYELLTYEHPFPGEKIRDVLRQVLEQDARPILGLEPDTPKEISDLVSRCLAKNPEMRPAGFGEVEAVLAPFVEGTGTGTGTRPKESIPLRDAHPTDEPDVGVSAKTRVVADPDPEGTNVAPFPPPPPPPPADGESPPTRPMASGLPAKPKRARQSAAVSRSAKKAKTGSKDPLWKQPLWLGVGAVVVLLLLGTVGFLLMPNGEKSVVQGPDGSDNGDEREPPRPPTLEGRLLIEASPWGRVVSVSGPDGDVALPADAATPLVLSVPPGPYTVEVMHPDSEEPATCTAEVPDADFGQCRVDLLQLDALDYFREAGWWR